MEPNKKMGSKRLDISIPGVQKAVAGLLKLSKVKKSDMLEDRQKVHLLITMKKIPNMPKLTINMNLPHGLFTPDTDVCLFVKDIDKASREFELTEDHVTEMLVDKGVHCIRKVISLKALKLEYKQRVAKRKLSNLFDLFLADDRIISQLSSRLGRKYYERIRNPIQVNLRANDLKKEISKAVNNTRCVIKNTGNSSMVIIGHTKQVQENIVENILKAVDQLIEKIPGGPDNIRSLHIKTHTSMSFPLYVTLGYRRKRTKNKQATEEIPAVNGQVKVMKSNAKENQKRKRKSSETEDKENQSGVKEKGTADGEEVENTGYSVVLPERKRMKNKQATEEIPAVNGQVKVMKSNVKENQKRKRKSSETEDKENQSGVKEKGTADGEEVEIQRAAGREPGKIVVSHMVSFSCTDESERPSGQTFQDSNRPCGIQRWKQMTQSGVELWTTCLGLQNYWWETVLVEITSDAQTFSCVEEQL